MTVAPTVIIFILKKNVSDSFWQRAYFLCQEFLSIENFVSKICLYKEIDSGDKYSHNSDTMYQLILWVQFDVKKPVLCIG
jgi:hypothetical protein